MLNREKNETKEKSKKNQLNYYCVCIVCCCCCFLLCMCSKIDSSYNNLVFSIRKKKFNFKVRWLATKLCSRLHSNTV